MNLRLHHLGSLGMCAWLLALLPIHAQAAPNPANGQKVFAEECAECHSIKEGKQKKGPSLFGVVGQPAARQAEFAYSEALHNSHLIWTADKIDAYLQAPKTLVPGGKMKYDGLAEASARADLIAYLSSLHP